jgi:hypothetical protein
VYNYFWSDLRISRGSDTGSQSFIGVLSAESLGTPLDERIVPGDSDPSRAGDSDTTIADDRPVDLISKSALDYHPRVGEDIDLQVDLSVGVVLGRSSSFHRKYQTAGLGMIGAVTETTDDLLTSLLGMPVSLDLMSPHVLFVAGKRGSGKSYTLGIIAEELALAMERQEIEVAPVIIDTVDVFRQCVEPNDDQESLLRKWNLQARGFEATIYVPYRTFASLPEEVREKARLAPLAISPSELSAADWGYVLERGGQLSTTMENLIGDVLDRIRRGFSLETGERINGTPDFSIKQMIQTIEKSAYIMEFYKPATRTALTQRLRRAQRLGIFKRGGTSAQDLAVAGRVTIIDVAPLGSDAETVLAILTNMLCRQVLTYRMAWTEEGTSAREELPPTWLIIDEAHTLVPRSGSTPAKNAIVGYAKLGRRFGCSLVLCTQQPSAVADEAISQADIIMSHALSHDVDIRALNQRAPAVMLEQFRDKVFISSLPRGVALVFDQSTENKRGFLMQVRPRVSQHGGTDRLSGLFEAAQYITPEGSSELEPDEEPLELVYDEIVPEDEEAVIDDQPRPPLKLNRESWELLEGWMKEYIQDRMERTQQDLSITEEPVQETVEPTDEEEPEVVLTEDFDTVNVRVKNFGPVPAELLSKASVRKILYTEVTHKFLLPEKQLFRESILSLKKDYVPVDLVSLVVNELQNLGFSVGAMISQDGFSFIRLRKNGIRAVITVATSDDITVVPVVMTGADRSSVNSLADRLRVAIK